MEGCICSSDISCLRTWNPFQVMSVFCRPIPLTNSFHYDIQLKVDGSDKFLTTLRVWYQDISDSNFTPAWGSHHPNWHLNLSFSLSFSSNISDCTTDSATDGRVHFLSSAHFFLFLITAIRLAFYAFRSEHERRAGKKWRDEGRGDFHSPYRQWWLWRRAVYLLLLLLLLLWCKREEVRQLQKTSQEGILEMRRIKTQNVKGQKKMMWDELKVESKSTECRKETHQNRKDAARRHIYRGEKRVANERKNKWKGIEWNRKRRARVA